MPLFRRWPMYLDGKDRSESYGDWLRRNLTHNIAAYALRNLPQDVIQLRENFEKFTGKSREELLRRYDGLKIQREDLAGVAVETIATASCARGAPTLLWAHGGGYAIGSVHGYREVAVRFSHKLRAPIVLFDYRLAPEHPFPAALDDALTVYDAIHKRVKGRPLYLFGDSAGGGLSLALLLKLRDEGRELPKGAILLSPWADLTIAGTSAKENASYDIMIRADRLPNLASAYVGSENPTDPLISPIFGDYAGLPPLLIFVGGREVLRDDGIRVHEAAKRAGVEAQLLAYPNMQHVWPILFKHLPESRKALREMGEWLHGPSFGGS